MSESRDQMVGALKSVVIPVLRERGFKGSLPHFRRRAPDRLDLMTFQFDKWGGGFTIEIAQAPLEGITTSWGEAVRPEKLTAGDIHPNYRPRLNPPSSVGKDGWFRFDSAISPEDFLAVASAVLPSLEEAESLFNQFPQALSGE
jgi:hypothetical protein